jgi:hypothetical protein
MPFAVGDRVRVIAENPRFHWGLVSIFDEGVITHVESWGVYLVRFPTHDGWRGLEEEFELACSWDMKFDEIYNGGSHVI